uniref:Exocyst subunit Exo70 family protein n=1 Tax=Kalanchoe fedtschenkoi TaxID=63787 RepID=A0A7N0TBK5_KALFE
MDAMNPLESACSHLRRVIQSSVDMESSLLKMDKRFGALEESLGTVSKRVAPLQSLAIARKALETRLNRAVSPAMALLDSFKLCESLQAKLLQLASALSTKKKTKNEKRLKILAEYVKSVKELSRAIRMISEQGEAGIQKLQEVVEFLSRTKAADQYRTHRLRETLVTLKALYETEVDGMKYDGLLDEALLILQDEFEGILEGLRHPELGEMMEPYELGTEVEIQVSRDIAHTLAANDCLDICIDIFVKARYRRAARALMSLNPDYLKTYSPEEIDEMDWENLETAITLWMRHFEVAVRAVFVSEKRLCHDILSGAMEGMIWGECFLKIADKIMAVFFRFGEGAARSNKEPHKLFKLLDMFDSLQKLRPHFSDIFEEGDDICSRYRELEKLLIHASSKAFWEFGLQIEASADALNPPPQNGSVPKLVRYAINYLKHLTTDTYRQPMTKVLQTEQIWKIGGLVSKPNQDQDVLQDAISNVLAALQRYIELNKTRYRDSILPHIFAMNSYWYIYMRSRNAELGKLLGELWMKKTFKVVAEESAYMYQKQAWGPLVQLLGKEAPARGKMEAFMKMFKEVLRAHKTSYSIPDFDLREQIREATLKFIVPAYAEFVESHSTVLQSRSYMSPEAVQESIRRIFDACEGNERVTARSGYLVEGNAGVSGEGSSRMKTV